jgi:ribonuclease HII
MCRYRITHLEREISISFQPRADGTHMTVALASMVSKYIREVCMKQFNRYWLQKKPGLAPTAGYPVDAARFYRSILPLIKEMNLDESAIWRRK